MKTIRINISLFFLFLASFSIVSAEAEDWTRFRGPNGSGVSDAETIPIEFTEKNTHWKIKLDGIGHSSPVTWGDHMYLLIADPAKEGDRSLVCFSLQSGKELWRVADTYETHVSNKKLNTFASCTPVTATDGVYFMSSTGTKLSVRGISHEGKPLWQQQLDGYTSDHGSAASPILVDGVLIINTDSKEEQKNNIFGIEAATGKILWTRERTDPDPLHKTVYSTPIIVKSDDQNTVTLVSTHHGWLGLDPKSGKTVWEHKENYRNRSVGSPVEKDGIVFATLGASGKGKLSAALRVGSEGKSPEVLYELEKEDGLGYVPTPLFVDDLLYLWSDKGFLTCRGAISGKEVYRERIGGAFFSSPIAIGGRIYCASSKGLMTVIQTGREFKTLASNDLGSGVFATPAVADGKLIIRTETHLMSIGTEK